KTEVEKEIVNSPLITRLLDMSAEEMVAEINSAIEDHKLLGTNQKKEIYEMIHRLAFYNRSAAATLKKKLDDIGDIKPGTGETGDDTARGAQRRTFTSEKPQLGNIYKFTGWAAGTFVGVNIFGLSLPASALISLIAFFIGWGIHELGHRIGRRYDESTEIRAGPLASLVLLGVAFLFALLFSLTGLSSIIPLVAASNYLIHIFSDKQVLFEDISLWLGYSKERPTFDRLRTLLPVPRRKEEKVGKRSPSSSDGSQKGIKYDLRNKSSAYITVIGAIIIILLSGAAACLWPQISAQVLKMQAGFGSPGNGAQLASLGRFMGMLLFGGVALGIGGRVMGIPVRYKAIGLEEMIESVRDLVKEFYRQVRIVKEYLVKVAVFGLPEVLGLGVLRKVEKPVVQIGRQREQIRLSWTAFWHLEQELPQERVTGIMALVKELNERKEIARFSAEESAYRSNTEINPVLEWTPLVREMKGRVREIEEFVNEVRGNYNRVEVFGEETVRAIEAGEINPEETLFVVSSPGRAYEYARARLIEFYRSQGISIGEIESKVAEHFIWIGEANTASAKKAGEMKILRRFNPAEGLLVLLALADVNIKGFLEGVKKGMVMCREKNVNNNPGAQFLILQEAMRKAGRNRVFLVLPGELEGFGKAWRELISLTGREDKGIIPILEGELASAESYGKNTAFIHVNVGAGLRARPSRNTGVALASLRKAGYPVFEIPLRSRKDIGALFYVAEFASAASYFMGIDRSTKVGGVETLSPVEEVGYQSEEASPAVAASFSLRKNEPFSEYRFAPEVLGGKATNVVAVDLDTLLEMKLHKEATASGMGTELRVRLKSIGALKVMKNIIDAAKEEGNPKRVNFAFICSKEGVTKEVIDRMLRDHMSACGLSTEDVARIIDKELIIDREALKKAGGIVGISRTQNKISAEAVFSIITERLLGTTGGNGIEVSIVTDSEDKWQRARQREIKEKILWVLLNPAGAGEVLSTAAGLVVAIEGKISRWLMEFIEKKYPGKAKELLPQIRKDGMIILPATRVDESYLEEIRDQEKAYKVEA
ncbi:MAG: hypothetical protein OEW43_03035, partial [Elusimicrobiota bacterium]|nr:hypothetical protein [Elusimicrobiota bacterium]